jgi:hypothetical protein
MLHGEMDSGLVLRTPRNDTNETIAPSRHPSSPPQAWAGESLLLREVTAVGHRLGLADEQPPTQSRFVARRL